MTKRWRDPELRRDDSKDGNNIANILYLIASSIRVVRESHFGSYKEALKKLQRVAEKASKKYPNKMPENDLGKPTTLKSA